MTDMEQVTQVAKGVSDYEMMAVTAAVSCVALLIGIAKELYDFFSGENFDLHDLEADVIGMLVGVIMILFSCNLCWRFQRRLCK